VEREFQKDVSKMMNVKGGVKVGEISGTKVQGN